MWVIGWRVFVGGGLMRGLVWHSAGAKEVRACVVFDDERDEIWWGKFQGFLWNYFLSLGLVGLQCQRRTDGFVFVHSFEFSSFFD